ncbi:MAG: carbon-nitrogen hydrolase family protein, partial [Ruminococcaceae bacterium]|nr:carbon-nitrogen hydrolase family protein [Oscillospiraceae bacterium]
ACKTSEPENNVYIVLTQKDANGKWIIRDHAANAYRDGDIIRFTDTVRMDEKAVSVTVELWLKGKYADVSWYQPHLYPCAPLGKRMVRAAAVHIKPTGRTYEANRDRLLAAVDAAAEQKADIILLGECMYDRCIAGTYPERSETEKGRMVTLMREKAKQHNCYIIYNFHENDNGEFYNTSLLIGRDGATVGKYRKTHLTLVELEGGLVPGDSYPVFDTDFGRIGMLICWDQYFSRTAEEVVKNGAEIIFVSTAGDGSHKSMARAMDAGVYMVIAGMNAAQTAQLPYGPTRIVTPDGEVLAHTDADLTPVVADIDLNEKQRMFWLSVGPADGEIHGIYRFEKNPDSFKGACR